MPQERERAPAQPTGESIGRPDEWSDRGRAPPGTQPGASVVRKPGEAATQDTPSSTPVTQDDYRPAPQRDQPHGRGAG